MYGKSGSGTDTGTGSPALEFFYTFHANLTVFDPSGRLFFHSPDPTPANQQYLLQQEQSDLRNGVRTINEVRASRGLSPVAWGDRPK